MVHDDRIPDEVLDRFRISGKPVRVIRDADENNDVIGTVVAWNDDFILIRKKNRKVVKLSRRYRICAADEPRISLEELL
jgi:hypothetical protein